ncbi:MAG: copper-binding protein [Chloroflexi bacterium]|nr:copper-binding protein [Chloroflexota bacterium]
MRLHLSLILVLATAVAACSQNGGTAASPGAPATVGPTRIEIRLTDALRIEPAEMTVPAGVPVTFVVTNTGAADHEFYLGDEAEQAAHAEEMAAMGGMAHDEPEGIAVEPGQTKELRYTFPEKGETLAGCHVDGHYAAGMKAAISVTG